MIAVEQALLIGGIMIGTGEVITCTGVTPIGGDGVALFSDNDENVLNFIVVFVVAAAASRF